MRVVVAVIFDAQNRVLITRRPLHATHGGMWEFPGGKIEEEESSEAALIREIKEEVGIDILEYSLFDELSHDYGTKIVNLLIYTVNKFIGEASCQESQLDLRWVSTEELGNYRFPDANARIIDQIIASVLE